MQDELERIKFSTDKHAAIIACPGSGKTSAIVRRAVQHLQNGDSAQAISIITFTTSAALEIRQRIRDLADPTTDVDQMRISTIHKFALDLLRSRDPHIKPLSKLQSFAILDEHFNKWNLQSLMPLLEETLTKLEGRHQTESQIRSHIVRMTLDAFEVCESLNLSYHEYIHPSFCEIVENAYSSYKNEITARGYINLGSMIVEAEKSILNFLPDDHESDWFTKLKYLFIDEYQDVNITESNFINTIMKAGIATWVVGDDDQAIYRFRGGSSEHLEQLSCKFGSYSLSSNWRNGGPIGAFSKKLSALLPRVNSKNINYLPSPGANLSMIWSSNSREEARNIFQRVQELRKIHEAKFEYEYNGWAKGYDEDEPESNSSIAVISYSKLGTLSDLKNLLIENDIPFREAGGCDLFTTIPGKLFERCLKFCSNQASLIAKEGRRQLTDGELREFVAIKREIHALLLLWFTPKNFKELDALELVLRYSDMDNRHTSVDHPAHYSPDQVDLIGENLLDKLGLISLQSIDEIFLSILTELRYYSPLIKDEAQFYLSKVQELISEYCSVSSRLSVGTFYHRFLRNYAMGGSTYRSSSYTGSPECIVDFYEGQRQSGIILSTIHRSKGLEFDDVIVAQLQEGTSQTSFPKTNGRFDSNALFKREFMPISPRTCDINDDLRLFYVAATRAEKSLTLSCIDSPRSARGFGKLAFDIIASLGAEAPRGLDDGASADIFSDEWDDEW